jgi:AhpD family alkylhydroperoxidase
MTPSTLIDAEPRPAGFPAGMKRMSALQTAVDGSELPSRISHLVRLLASQINGCSYCIDMHVDEALADGIDERLLHLLPTWRKVDRFDAREQAALALTEAVTLVSESHVPRDVWDRAADVFDEEELGALLWQIIAINAWNRLAISLRMPPASLSAAEEAVAAG